MSKRTLAYDTVAEKTIYRQGGVDYEITIEGGSGITDAPTDGKVYAREDGEWVEATPAKVGADAAGTGAAAVASHVSGVTHLTPARVAAVVWLGGYL
jgi:hypothetical protein